MSKLPVAVYTRISKDSEAMGLGVERQRQDCENLAAKLDWQVVEVFTDNDVSATRSKVRPAYQRMVTAIESGRVRGIIVYAVDRLTRTPRELEDVIDWAKVQGLQLASVSTMIDLSTPDGRAMARQIGTFSKLEAERQSERLKRKLLELAENGRYVGPRPFGWDWTVNDDGTKGKNLTINKAEAALVKEAADRLLRGDSIHAICRDLNAAGVLTARGAKWRSQNVRKLLMRPANAAIRVHNGTEVGPGNWPAIFSRGTHDRLLAVLTDAQRVTNRGTRLQHLLSGLIKCNLCGSPMYAARATSKRSKFKLADGTIKYYESTVPAMYRCTPPGCQRVQQSQEHLDQVVSEYVLRLMHREGVEIFGGDDATREHSTAKVQSIEAKLDLVADQFAEDEITLDQLKRINGKLRAALLLARRELRQARPDEEMAEFTGPSVRSAWGAATLERRRALLRSLLDFGLRITVGQPGLHPPERRFNPETVYIKATWKPEDR